jgi:hypothetical protein
VGEKRIEGEVRFEAYLNAMGYPFVFETEHPGKRKKPDYTLTLGETTYLFDVKDADPHLPRGFNQFDPHPEIIERVKAGLKKFREYKEFPCGIVLQNNGHTPCSDLFPGKARLRNIGFADTDRRCVPSLENSGCSRTDLSRIAQCNSSTVQRERGTGCSPGGRQIRLR